LFDPTFVYPERSLRGADSCSRPNLGQLCYPLCFDNDPFCLSCLPRSARGNPFLLMTIWIAHVWKSRSSQSASSFVYSLATERNASLLFSTTCALFAQTAPQEITPNAFPFMALRTLDQNNGGGTPLPSNACFLPMLFFPFHFQKVSAA